MTLFDAEQRPLRIEEDADGDGQREILRLFESGKPTRTEQDRNADGKPDLFAYYEDGEIVRQEEDSDFDGRIDLKSRAGKGNTRVQEVDTNSDGETDTWITTDSGGKTVKREEDRSLDGRPDFIAFFKDGVLTRVDERDPQTDCLILRQWVRKDGTVTAEEKDTTRDCKSDTWNYYRNGKLVRQGLATAQKGYPDLLSARIDGEGRVTVQEIASQGKRPTRSST